MIIDFKDSDNNLYLATINMHIINGEKEGFKTGLHQIVDSAAKKVTIFDDFDETIYHETENIAIGYLKSYFKLYDYDIIDNESLQP